MSEEREHHPHSPSSWAKWLSCAVFKSGPVGFAAYRGTAMHDEWQKQHLKKCKSNSRTTTASK